MKIVLQDSSACYLSKTKRFPKGKKKSVLSSNRFIQLRSTFKIVSKVILKPLCIFKVVVKWLLSPVNPADINTIQGKYPSKPTLPAVPGNEGVGEILDVGSKVKNFSIGDRVIPNGVHNGTWRTHAIYGTEKLMKVY